MKCSSFRFWVNRGMYWFHHDVCLFFVYVIAIFPRKMYPIVVHSLWFQMLFSRCIKIGHFLNFSTVFPTIAGNWRKIEKERKNIYTECQFFIVTQKLLIESYLFAFLNTNIIKYKHYKLILPTSGQNNVISKAVVHWFRI